MSFQIDRNDRKWRKKHSWNESEFVSVDALGLSEKASPAFWRLRCRIEVQRGLHNSYPHANWRIDVN